MASIDRPFWEMAGTMSTVEKVNEDAPGRMRESVGARLEEPTVTLVYLAWGPRRLVEITAFSILTFLRVAPDLGRPYRIMVYTDQPATFRRYGIEAEFVGLETLGDSAPATARYLHRSKMVAVQHAAEAYPGHVFYLDGDTYFTTAPVTQFAGLSATSSIMHVREYRLSQGRADLHEVVRTREFQSRALRVAKTWSDVAMWNAGAVGIAEANKRLIPEVLGAADELYSYYGHHISEQLAWNLVLSQVGDLRPIDDALYHYWFGKEELYYRVSQFLQRNRKLPHADLVEKAYAFQPQVTENWRPPAAVRARVAARSVWRSPVVRGVRKALPAGHAR